MKIDFSTLAGVGGTALVVIVAIAFGGGHSNFMDPASFVLVLGGTLLAVLGRRSAADFIDHLRALRVVARSNAHDGQQLAQRLRQWSLIARRDGTLALEQQANASDPRIMQEALMMLVDGANEQAVREGLTARLAALEERHRRIIATWEEWLVVAPAMGMIGTLIGLVQMLGKMHDASGVGQAMALALLTTLYGAFLANIFAGPVASKLQLKHAAEMAWCEDLIAGASRIARGEMPLRMQSAVVMPFPGDRGRSTAYPA
jgi:chemotaxis protein MotA